MIPKATQDYLVHGAFKGNRNNSLMSAACQLRDDGVSLQEAGRILIPRSLAAGLTEYESRSTIRSVFNRPPRDPCGGGYPKVFMNGESSRVQPVTFCKIPVQPEPLPAAMKDADAAALRFLESKFRPGEFVSIGHGYEKIDNKNGEISIAITAGVSRTLEKWIADIGVRGLDAVFPFVEGVFVRVNPMKDGEGSTDADVALYRDILVESDVGSLQEQFGAIKAIGLPISGLAWSANRSIQGHVTVNAPDEDTYRERFSILRQFCVESLGLQMDAQNVNPSRYSRLPGGRRTRRDHDTNQKILDQNGQPIIDRQTLLAVNLAGKTWDDWFDALPIDDGAEVFTVTDLLAFDRTNDPDSLFGDRRWAGRGGSVVLQGPAGIGKSSFLMQWIVCASLGRPFLDIPCFTTKDGTPRRVILIQAENDKGDLSEAFQDITDAMNLTEAELAQVQSNVTFIRQDQKSGLPFIDFARARIKRHRPDIVFGDPLLAYIGGDILKQEIASQFLRNWLNPLLREFGLLWIWAQHTGKPRNESGVQKTHEEKKYSGLSSSELTNWAREIITMSELADGIFEMDFGKRWRRTGILNAEGRPVRTINIQQSDRGTVWERVQGQESSVSLKEINSNRKQAKVRHLIQERKTVTIDQVKTWAPSNQIGINDAVTIARALAHDESTGIFSYKAHVHGSTNKATVFSVFPESSPQNAACPLPFREYLEP